MAPVSIILESVEPVFTATREADTLVLEPLIAATMPAGVSLPSATVIAVMEPALSVMLM